MRTIISAARIITILFGLTAIVSCSESKSDMNVILSKPTVGIDELDAKLIQFNEAQKTELLSLREDLNFLYDIEILYNYPEALIKGRETLKKFSINKADLDEYLVAIGVLEKAYAGVDEKWRLEVKSGKASRHNSIEKMKKRVARTKGELALLTNAQAIKIYTKSINRAEKDIEKRIARLATVGNDKDYKAFRRRALQSEATTAWYPGVKIYSEITDAEFEKLLKTAAVLDYENSVALNNDTELFIFWAKTRIIRSKSEITKTYSANSAAFKENKLIKLNVFEGTKVGQKDWLSVFAAFNDASK